jgi:hypothetical protein
LINQRSGDQSQASSLEAQITQDRLGPAAVSRGSYVLDPAVTLPVSGKQVIVKDALSGLVAGLGLGIGGVIVAEIVSDRPRRRVDVATALGAPVELSLGRYSRDRWRRRRRVTQPTAALRMVQRRLRAQLEAAPDSSLAIVVVDALEPADLAVAGLATTLVSEGKRVIVADVAPGRPLASLFRVNGSKAGTHSVAVGERTLTLTVAPDDPAEMSEKPPPGDFDAVLLLTRVDAALGADYIVPWARRAMVSVTVGKASMTRLRATGQMLRQAGIALRSAILVGADADDESLGAVNPDGDDDQGQPTLGVLQAARR